MAINTRSRLSWLQPLILGAAMLAPAAAWAGEVKFGNDALATDDDGKLTSEASAATTTTLKSEPGEELWVLNLWAKIDKGAPGPLYVEFEGKQPGGKTFTAYRYEHAAYDGEKYVSLSIELDGNSASFNKGRTYTVRVLQGAAKAGRKDIVLATSQLTLEYTEPPEEAEGESEDVDDTAAQDALDTLDGPDEDVGDTAPEEGPPAVDPAASKKGCSIGATDLGFPGLAALFALGFVRRRRD